MRILLSNDDGINAEGLAALREALAGSGEIWVVSPEWECSGSSHGITVHTPLRPRKVHFPDGVVGWSVNGTPADCVKLAIEALLPHLPDIVVSGINLGANLGTDVIYSGTVSAAVEGVINDIPSIAVSLAAYRDPDYSYAAEFMKNFIERIKRKGLPKGKLLNINVPSGRPRGVKVTRLGMRKYVNVFHRRVDPRGREYYWMAGEPQDIVLPAVQERPVETDIQAIADQFISITPLQLDLTDYGNLEDLIEWIGVTS